LLWALASSTPSLAEHANHAQGFRPEHVFQAGGIEHVDLANGNLTLTIPIGQSYPLGPKLSYHLTLVYTGDLWTWDEETDTSGATYLQAEPRATATAGLGWNLSLGRLVPSSDPTNPSPFPAYQTPDQGLHQLYDRRLHPNGQLVDGAEFTQDSTYLRFDTGQDQMDLPDGTVQTFGPDGLSKIEDPYGHDLTIKYLSRDAQGDAHDWQLEDSYGREHHILFTRHHGRLVVSEVDLEPFGGGLPAVYTFHYVDLSIPRACNEPLICDGTYGQCGNTSTITEPLLTKLDLPDGSSYEMPTGDYHIDPEATCGQRAINGQLEGMTLPTGGSFEWDWEVWAFPKASADPGGVLSGNYPDNPFSRSVGLSERRWIDRAGVQLGSWTYTHELRQDPSDPAARELVVTVKNMPPGDSTKHYFSVYPGRNDGLSDPAGGWTKYEYGLPFTRRVDDGSSPGRYLSTQVYDKHDTLLRTTYVRYERDGASKANPRLVSERTVYDDDSGRHADLDLSGFDGLGHYRTRDVSGNFTGANDRTVYTDFNPGRSLSNIPGLTDPWILDTYDLQQTSEGGQTVAEEADFDATGFLHRLRRRAGATCGGHDVVVERTPFKTPPGQSPIPEAGFPAREDFYGGDSQSLACGGLEGLTLPDQPVYRRKHTYSCGSLATTRWFVPGGNALSFYSTDQDIDCPTGLVSKSRDPANLATTYDYDSSGRILTVTPGAGEATTSYTYSNDSATLPARVTIERKSAGTSLTHAQVRFDGFGRVAEERRTMPAGTKSVRTTDWNSRGWIDQRSEWHQEGAAAPQTLFRQYDPFGRPGSITLPDGQKITIDYSGVSSRAITVKVATSLDQATDQPILANATTTEVYDRFGRLAQVDDPEGTRTSYGYDAMDDLTLVQENDPGPPKQTRSFAYDGRGFLTSETHPELGTSVLYSKFDPLGNPGRIRRGGEDLSYSYDSAARLTAIAETGTTRVWKSWSYGTADFQAGHWSNGKLIEASRLNRLPYPPAPSVILEPTVTEGYTYDALGEVTSRDYPNCTYAHCSEATGSHVVTQGFTEGLLSSVPQLASSITYHPNGLWAQVAHTNGVTDVQESDASGMARPGRLSTTGASQNFDTGPIAYDGAGNVTKMGTDRYVYDLLSRVGEAAVEVPQEGCGQVTVVQGKTDMTTKTYQSCGTVQAGPDYTVGATGDVTLTAGHAVILENGFSVASGGRLVAGVDPSLDPAGQPTAAGQTYTFDRFGNLTQVVTSHEGQADVTTPIGTFSNSNHLSAGVYDASGNLVSFPGVSWSYDPFNMLTQEASTTGSHFYFIYGPGDERIWTINWSGGADPSSWHETWTLRDLGGSPLRQYRSIGGNNAQANWTATAPDFPRDYVWRGGSLLGSVTRANVVRHFHLDHLGSPRMVTDAGGKTFALHLYFPFGQEATDPDQDNLSLKFTGQERDDLDPFGSTYDLDYMHARFYSPAVGRFLSFDYVGGNPAWPGSWNRYAYALGSPLNLIDPRGKYPTEFVGQIGFDYLQCLINGGCESIEVTADDPGYNPLTGVAGLRSLISGNSFLNGLDNLGIKRHPTPTIGPAPPEKPNTPARPDYVTLSLSLPVPTPYTGTIFGGTGTLTLDRNGNLYGGLGPNAGKGLFLVGVTLTAGGISGSDAMTPAQMTSVLSGVTNNFSFGFLLGGGFSRSGFSGPKSAEAGLMSPTIGVSSTYSWQLFNIGIKW
jgi:RHS repeat-associated protein